MEVKETMHEDSHEGGRAYDEKLWLRIPFRHVNFAIRQELAMLLDPPSSNDWRMLGDRLGFLSKEILVGGQVPYVDVQETLVEWVHVWGCMCGGACVKFRYLKVKTPFSTDLAYRKSSSLVSKYMVCE